MCELYLAILSIVSSLDQVHLDLTSKKGMNYSHCFKNLLAGENRRPKSELRVPSAKEISIAKFQRLHLPSQCHQSQKIHVAVLAYRVGVARHGRKKDKCI